VIVKENAAESLASRRFGGFDHPGFGGQLHDFIGLRA
jgi:hypothetical protein